MLIKPTYSNHRGQVGRQQMINMGGEWALLLTPELSLARV